MLIKYIAFLFQKICFAIKPGNTQLSLVNALNLTYNPLSANYLWTLSKYCFIKKMDRNVI